MTRATLSPAELAFFRLFRLGQEAVLSRIEGDLLARAELSLSEFDVLSTLAEHPRGKLRQQRLADHLRWEKSRLSHQLSRMERRELVLRQRDNQKLVLVTLTRAGRARVRAARPTHAAAVRKYLLASIPASAQLVLARSLAHLSNWDSGRD